MGQLTMKGVNSIQDAGRYTDGDGLMLLVNEGGSARSAAR